MKELLFPSTPGTASLSSVTARLR